MKKRYLWFSLVLVVVVAFAGLCFTPDYSRAWRAFYDPPARWAEYFADPHDAYTEEEVTAEWRWADTNIACGRIGPLHLSVCQEPALSKCGYGLAVGWYGRWYRVYGNKVMASYWQNPDEETL